MGQLRLREGWMTFTLVVLMLLSVVWSLQSANWAPDLDLLNWVVLGGAALGLFLARARVPGLLAHLFAGVVGVTWIVWLSLRFFPEFETWEEKLAELVVRVVLWVDAAVSGGMSADNLIFVLEMSLLLWLISYSAVWYLLRNNSIWAALVPSGATILVNTYYAQHNLNFFLVTYLICAFLLIIRSYLTDQEEKWRANGVAYNPDLALDFLRDGALFAAVVIVLAWTVPAAVERKTFNPVLARLGGPLGEAQQTWSRLFASLNYRPAAASSSWFGRSMAFQGPLSLSDEMVMEVEAPEGRYWRAVVFDKYTSAGWIATTPQTIELEGEQPAVPGFDAASTQARNQITQKYTIFNPAGHLIFAAAQPVQVSVPARMLVAGPARGQPDGGETALAQLYSKVPLYSGQQYSVVSAINHVDERSLRESSTGYAEYIRDHYTALPDTLPERVRTLAAEITAGQPTAYDKAKAIESYLRSLPYDETIPGPRPGEDGVDYFLFREQAGYCDYYASAMAVMLRSIGIPARVAQGYSRGEQSQDSPGRYEVRQRDAHTWVEAFFPGYGWIEFEPTAAEPVIERAADRITAEEAGERPAVPTPSGEREDSLLEKELRLEEEMQRQQGAVSPFQFFTGPMSSPAVQIPLGALVLLALAAGSITLALRLRWRQLSLIERIFDQLGLAGRFLGVSQRPVQTPQEYADELGSRVPPVRQGLNRLATIFGRARFSPRPLDPEEETEANEVWRASRVDLLKGAAAQRLPRRRPTLNADDES